METIKRWVVSNQQGRDIFYFELYTIDGIPNSLYFDSNLTFQVKHEKLIDLLGLLVSNNEPIEKKERIAGQFFALIKRIKFYEHFYFRDAVLDKHGKLNMASYNLIQQMLQGEHSRLVPFSSTYNEEVFTLLEEHYYLHKDEIAVSTKEITKTIFESQLINDLLRLEYFNYYTDLNKFYLYDPEGEDKTYFILLNDRLQFSFDVK